MQFLAASLVVGGPALAPLPVLECVGADYFSNVLKESALGPVRTDEALKNALAAIVDIVSPSVYALVPPVESLKHNVECGAKQDGGGDRSRQADEVVERLGRVVSDELLVALVPLHKDVVGVAHVLLVELVVLERRDEVAVGVYVRGLGIGEGHGRHPESVCFSR